MELKALFERYAQHPMVAELEDLLTSQNNPKILLKGMCGSLHSFIGANLAQRIEQPFVFVLNNKEEAAYVLNEVEKMLPKEKVLFYPGSYRRPYQIEETDNANVLMRAEVLSELNSRRKSPILITYPDALFELVITKKELKKNTFKISVGDQFEIDFIYETLLEYNFDKVDFVSQPGEFSVRGGIVDVFSFSNDQPYRIEFFGDEVESIRAFDIEDQLSQSKLKSIALMPNVEDKHTAEKRESFFNFISKDSVLWMHQVSVAGARIKQLYEKAQETFDRMDGEVRHLRPDELFMSEESLYEVLTDFSLIEVNNAGWYKTMQTLELNALPQPAFNKHFDLLDKSLKENHEEGVENVLLCSNEKQATRFRDIFDDIDSEVPFSTIIGAIHEGFIDKDLQLAVYTDHQIFERYHKFKLKSTHEKTQALTLKELNNLELGDYVTHIDHGIGRFGGLHKIDVDGKMQEAIKLTYHDNDILYVSIHSLHKIAKFTGKDGRTPKINKLGSPAWKNLKNKTKRKVKEVAFDLIKLYAKRRSAKGYAFAPDNYLQHELEASFLYEDTPDQLKSTQAVKADMESERPMDRLVCGDVGFGKTEVAIRAAFKAVCDSKQVAVLVPTTILAFQHHKTFKSRLEDLPARVEYLNRFKTAKQKREILKDLEEGKIDIIIGTHQLVGKTVKFKDLGLLIVDEEQKFGVSVKDKLKTLRENVDTLTLTATPIPRTLQFSLMAARDLSVINTPPPNRYPIDTQVIGFNEEIMRDAVSYEISRGGQVFFIHNKIENIREVAGMINRLVPDAKVAFGHGQMEGKELEKLMLAFMEGEFDVLVSTTIIESGLDVPNANTIFINNAQNFGLSDLHQMRGRVGRSNKKAFCYYIAPPYSAMTDDARKRLQALEQYSGLGQGFNIAMKDLEIRGAGDMLGAEQSGFISDIGFDTYQKIMAEAIEELKEEEFYELYKDSINDMPNQFVKETQLDTDFEILIPDAYVENIAERLNLYKELAQLKDVKELGAFSARLEDRFGPSPQNVKDLLLSMQVKWLATDLGFERLILKKHKMIATLVKDQKSAFYQSETFSKLLQYVQQHPDEARFREKKDKNGEIFLSLSFSDVNSIHDAKHILSDIKD